MSRREALRADRAARAARQVMRSERMRSPAAARQAIRGDRLQARGAVRNAAAMRAFSGREARLRAGYAVRDAALATRNRGDFRSFDRTRFAGAFWPGPFFWPYAYYDDAFWLWPSSYDDVFWAYGYDDMLYGIYRPYAFSDYGDFLGAIGRPVRRARSAPPAPGNFAELCGEAAPGLTDWPVDSIERAVAPMAQQRTLLDELVRASNRAAEQLRAACPRNVPVTPIGRLDTLQRQLSALAEAARTVRPALERFYTSLSDDQKERFNALGPNSRPDGRRARGPVAPQADRLARACQGGGATADWPIERIETAVQPNGSQREALTRLRAATEEAARVLQAACPSELPLTPTGRLAAIETRIDALLQATSTLRPALSQFYTALNDEQKARFNRALESADRRAGRAL